MLAQNAFLNIKARHIDSPYKNVVVHWVYMHGKCTGYNLCRSCSSLPQRITFACSRHLVGCRYHSFHCSIHHRRCKCFYHMAHPHQYKQFGCKRNLVGYRFHSLDCSIQHRRCKRSYHKELLRFLSIRKYSSHIHIEGKEL